MLTKEYMDLIGNGAVGAVTEFCISENPIDVTDRDVEDIIEDAQADCCYGYYLTDDDVWNEDIMKSKGMLSAPNLEVDGEIMDFGKAVKWVNEQEVAW